MLNNGFKTKRGEFGEVRKKQNILLVKPLNYEKITTSQHHFCYIN
jgi:hypothetical protein